jgi:RNA polymerase sigma-70 factor (ECF subfamily)
MPWLRSDVGWQVRFLRGEPDVIEDVYRRTFEQVRRAAGGVIREPADRDSVVHETFLELLSSRRLRESYRGGELAAWLGAIARHRALDYVRRQGRLTDLSEVREAEPYADTVGELRGDIRRFAARLDPKQRELLELRYFAGMTQVEAASALGMPRSTLEDWERHLKRLLKDFLLGSPRRGGGGEVFS